MAEFDDKLNSLLSNPEAMDQIMKMAQSLMGNGGGTEQPPPAAPPSGETGSAAQNGGLLFQQSGPTSKPKPVSQQACGERSAGVWPGFSLRTG